MSSVLSHRGVRLALWILVLLALGELYLNVPLSQPFIQTIAILVVGYHAEVGIDTWRINRRLETFYAFCLMFAILVGGLGLIVYILAGPFR